MVVPNAVAVERQFQQFHAIVADESTNDNQGRMQDKRRSKGKTGGRKRPAVGYHARRSDRRRRQCVQNANRFRRFVGDGSFFRLVNAQVVVLLRVVELMIVVGSGVTGGSGFLGVLRISVVVDLASGRAPVVFLVVSRRMPRGARFSVVADGGVS